MERSGTLGRQPEPKRGREQRQTENGSSPRSATHTRTPIAYYIEPTTSTLHAFHRRDHTQLRPRTHATRWRNPTLGRDAPKVIEAQVGGMTILGFRLTRWGSSVLHPRLSKSAVSPLHPSIDNQHTAVSQLPTPRRHTSHLAVKPRIEITEW